jgi:hypothetical protein
VTIALAFGYLGRIRRFKKEARTWILNTSVLVASIHTTLNWREPRILEPIHSTTKNNQMQLKKTLATVSFQQCRD